MTKKLNPKIAAVALMLLTFLVAGGVAIKEGIAPSGFAPDPDGDGGGG